MLPGAHPVLSCAEAQEFEKNLLGNDETLEWGAMQRAGRGLAGALMEDVLEAGGLPDDARLLVLCGKGHNGGDALIAAHAILDATGAAKALVALVPDFAALRPLVRRALEALASARRGRVEFVCVSGNEDGRDVARTGVRIGEARFDLCLDGLFGMQFRPPLRPPASWLLPLDNQHRSIRLRAAVDVPSGIGDASDGGAFRADFTYATGIAKLPLFAPANRPWVGRVRYVDIGFFDADAPSRGQGIAILTPRMIRSWSSLRESVTDKRKFGHLFVVSGARDMPGAVLMAVESALLSGVGLVTAFVPESIAASAASRLPEAMWVPMPETPAGGLALEGRAAVVARSTRCTGLLTGPGLGRDRETQALIRELLKAIDVPAVVDGDALFAEVIAARKGMESPVILTPHAGEFARISGGEDTGDDALRGAVGRLRATIVLKGAPTRVAAGETIHVSPFGGPVLARGGSGDFLAGLIGGLASTGMDPLLAAACGTVWHGMAADAMARTGGQSSARVTRLAEYFSAVLRSPEVTGG